LFHYLGADRKDTWLVLQDVSTEFFEFQNDQSLFNYSS